MLVFSLLFNLLNAVVFVCFSYYRCSALCILGFDNNFAKNENMIYVSFPPDAMPSSLVCVIS